MMRRGLEELGHEVNMKPVLTANDAIGYDRALVHVGAPSSLSNGYLPGAAITLAIYGDDARVYVDDWSAERLADDIAAHVERQKGWERHLAVFRPKEWGRLGGVKHVEAGREALLRFLDPAGPPWLIAGPFFNWGDPTNFFQTGKRKINAAPFGIDPSPMMTYPDVMRLPKERKWVLATLQNHDRWLRELGARWPVGVIGAQQKAVGGVRKSDPGSPVVPEAEVVQWYSNCWGVLSPWYKTAGSGWWRARFNYSAHVGSIIYCGDDDGAAIGPSFTNPIDLIEEASDRELVALADRQAQRLWEHESPRDEFLERMEELVA
jgi:hypothetical protein